MKTRAEQIHSMRWVLFWIFCLSFVLILIATLSMIFFDFGYAEPRERGILFNVFLGEVGLAVLALFYSIFGLRAPASSQLASKVQRQEVALIEPETKAAEQGQTRPKNRTLLSLRNVAGAFVLIMVGIAAYQSWINQDYKSLIASRQNLIEDLRDHVEKKSEEVLRLRADLIRLEGNLESRTFENSVLKKELEEKTALLASNQNQDVRELLRENEFLQRKLTSATDDFLEQKANLHRTIDETETKYNVRLVEVKEQINDAVEAWNQLVSFLGSRAEGRTINMPRRDLDRFLRGTEEITREVPGMKYKT